MKKTLIILLCILSTSFFFFVPKLDAKTLGELKQDLADAIAEKDETEARRREAQAKIAQYDKEIKEATASVEKCEDDIDASRAKITELEAEIVEKNKEIEELLRFIQISNGENIYLEYVFGATSFTDFIYRISIVEQLSEYNDELIDEMYVMIEENKQLQKDLAQKIIDLENEILNFQAKLASLNISVDDIDEHQKDLNAEIKAATAEIKYYEDYGCKADQEISDCLNVPYATGFTRPTNSGYISSNYGYRYIWGGTSFHNGIDIALSEGNKVFASAAGYVSKVVKRASCGGNIVYINHNIEGVEYTSVYMHLLSYNVEIGDIVSLITVIGASGGSSTMWYDSCTQGAHLHFAIYKGHTTSSSYSRDPRNYINFPAKGSRYYSRW